MNQPHDEDQKEKAQKRKNQIVFVVSSFSALIIVGAIGYFALGKIRNQKMSDILNQEQFEGGVEISSQLQAECQSSVAKMGKAQDPTAIEQEFRANVENCKDVYFTSEGATPFRKEGMYADLVVDIAKKMATTDRNRAVELLKYARDLKPWDFYLGPVSCDSQHVLDAYIESYALDESKTCIAPTEIKAKLSTPIVSKDYSILSKLVNQNEVVWLGMPESDSGCPEKVSSVIEILKKLTPGPITFENADAPPNDNGQYSVNIKLSDKENITMVLANEQDCLHLSTVLVPNLDVSE